MAVKKYSLSELKATYIKSGKENHDIRFPYVKYIMRPLSFPVSLFLLNSGISANQITITYIIFAIFGSFLFATGNYKLALFGGLCINLLPLLDQCDGNIARIMYKQKNLKGVLLDQTADSLVYVFVFPLAGLGIYFGLDDGSSAWFFSLFHPSLAEIPSVLFLMLGSLLSLFHILKKLMGTHYEKLANIKYEKLNQKKIPTSPKLDNHHSKPKYSIFYAIDANLFSSGGILYPILFLAILTKMLGLFLLLFTIIQIISFFLLFSRRLQFLAS